MDPEDLNSPRPELSSGGLKSVVTLLVRWQIIFLSAQTLTLNPAVVIRSYSNIYSCQYFQNSIIILAGLISLKVFFNCVIATM